MTLVKSGVCRLNTDAIGLPVVQFSGLFTDAVVAAGVGGGGKAHQNPFALQARLQPVAIGVCGLRRDRPLFVNQNTMVEMQKTKLCHWFYLVGKCKGCDKIHDPSRKLSEEEFDALWLIARRGECYKSRKRQVCRDILCIYGHKEGGKSI